MGKLFVRIHQSSRQKQIQTKPGEPEPLTVRRMKRFLQWVVKFLCESASPASSFDRKWMALLVFKEVRPKYLSCFLMVSSHNRRAPLRAVHVRFLRTGTAIG